MELGVSSEEAKHSQFKSIRGANGYFFPKKNEWLAEPAWMCVCFDNFDDGVGDQQNPVKAGVLCWGQSHVAAKNGRA